MLKIEVPTLADLPEVAKKILNEVPAQGVWIFRAPMGAGKTTLIAELARQLGVEEDTSSPTFSIVNEYDTRVGNKIYHFDCYRLESPEEAFDIGAEDYFDSGNLCLIEWPEILEHLLPDEVVEIGIAVEPDGKRIITIDQ